MNSLNIRRKAPNYSKNVKPGLLVLIKEDNVPCMEWSIGRIVEIHPGLDNIVRTVTVKTKGEVKKRPVTKIAILPVLAIQNCNARPGGDKRTNQYGYR